MAFVLLTLAKNTLGNAQNFGRDVKMKVRGPTWTVWGGPLSKCSLPLRTSSSAADGVLGIGVLM